MITLFKTLQLGSREDVFFWSDIHFGHKRQAEHRGFQTTEAMDEWLAAQWNVTVPRTAIVFVVGDFILRRVPTERQLELVQSLHGTVNFVPGNHDAEMDERIYAKFARVFPGWQHVAGTHRGERYRICLSHFPMLVWDRLHYETIHLHGHCHGSLEHPAGHFHGKMFDIGVDANLSLASGCRPVSLSAVLEAAGKRSVITYDHHKVHHEEHNQVQGGADPQELPSV